MSCARKDSSQCSSPVTGAAASSSTTSSNDGALARTAAMISAPSTPTPMKATTRPMPQDTVIASCRRHGRMKPSSARMVAGQPTSAASCARSRTTTPVSSAGADRRRKCGERGDIVAAFGKLRSHQATIRSVPRDQFGVAAAVRDRAVGQHQDAVGVDHAGEAMRQDQRGAAGHQPIERLLDHRLVLRIDRGQRLVQHQDRRVAQQRAGDGDALALAARQARAAFADHGLVAVGQRLDEVVRVGGAGGGDKVGLAGVGAARGAGCPRSCRGTGRCPAPPPRSSGAPPRDRARAGPGRRYGPRRSADRAGAAAGGRWWICRNRWGRRCRRARRRRW